MGVKFKKLKIFILATSIASFSFIAYPNAALAQFGGFFPDYEPFGGKVNFMLPCYCNDRILDTGSVLFVGDPVGGRFYYQVFETRLYREYQPIFNHWVLGLADNNDEEWCFIQVYLVGCVPIYRASVIKHMGTS